MTTSADRPPRLPPPWFVHSAWRIHRLLHRVSAGRALWPAGGKRGWGAMRLTTIGRTSGEQRLVIVGYLHDGENLVALAMNGWDEGDPAWWLNLVANPVAEVQLAHQPPRRVRARAAEGEERERLWRLFGEVDRDLEHYAALRSCETPVVVFEPVA